MRIRKQQSSFGNSSCLAKTKNLLFYVYGDALEEIGTKRIPWGNCASLNQRSFMVSPKIDTNEELTTNHEKADTLLLLHAKNTSTVFPSIIIKTPDTDVFLLCLSQQHELSADLYVVTSTSRSSCLISARSVAEKCGPVVSSTLLSQLAFHWL